MLAPRRRCCRPLGHPKIVAAEKGRRIREKFRTGKGSRLNPPQETPRRRQISRRIRTRTRHHPLRARSKSEIAIPVRARNNLRNFRPQPSNLQIRRKKKPPPGPGRTPSSLLRAGPAAHHPPRPPHNHHPAQRPDETRTPNVGRRNPLDPPFPVAAVAPQTAGFKSNPAQIVFSSPISSTGPCGASLQGAHAKCQPHRRRCFAFTSAPTQLRRFFSECRVAALSLFEPGSRLNTRPPNSHSMLPLPVHHPLTTIHQFPCPKCNQLR